MPTDPFHGVYERYLAFYTHLALQINTSGT